MSLSFVRLSSWCTVCLLLCMSIPAMSAAEEKPAEDVKTEKPAKNTDAGKEKAEEKKSDEKTASLHDLMESIKDDYKTAYKVIKGKDAAKKDDALKALDSLKKNAEAAKKLTPHKIEDIKDADEQKKMKESYVKEMDVLIANIDKLKTKISAEDWDGSLTLIREMSTHKKKSHEQFQDEEEEH